MTGTALYDNLAKEKVILNNLHLYTKRKEQMKYICTLLILATFLGCEKQGTDSASDTQQESNNILAGIQNAYGVDTAQADADFKALAKEHENEEAFKEGFAMGQDCLATEKTADPENLYRDWNKKAHNYDPESIEYGQAWISFYFGFSRAWAEAN